MTKLEILKQKMEKWIHPTDEELIEAIREYIVRIEGIGSALSGDFIDMISNLQGNAISTPKKKIVTSDNSDVIEQIRNVIYEVLGSHIKTTKASRYNVTTFGEQGRKILAEFIQTTPDELPALVEAIKCYYRDIDVPKAINNFFVEGVYKNYKDFLQEDVSAHSYSKMI